jgi:hypothetical protein
MLLNIVTFIAADHQEDEVASKVHQRILGVVVDADTLDTLELVINTLTYAVLRISLGKNLEGHERGVSILLVLFYEQVTQFTRVRCD